MFAFSANSERLNAHGISPLRLIDLDLASKSTLVRICVSLTKTAADGGERLSSVSHTVQTH
jgi:hypothetical protein